MELCYTRTICSATVLVCTADSTRPATADLASKHIFVSHSNLHINVLGVGVCVCNRSGNLIHPLSMLMRSDETKVMCDMLAFGNIHCANSVHLNSDV